MRNVSWASTVEFAPARRSKAEIPRKTFNLGIRFLLPSTLFSSLQPTRRPANRAVAYSCVAEFGG
jgi:hypothetical protein